MSPHVPEELTSLPSVESKFNYDASSPASTTSSHFPELDEFPSTTTTTKEPVTNSKEVNHDHQYAYWDYVGASDTDVLFPELAF